MAIKHHALLLTLEIEDVWKLCAAARIVNAPNPQDALEFIDCDPPTVAHLAANMNNARSPYNNASYALVKAMEIVGRVWEGAAKEAFLRAAAPVVLDLPKAQRLTDQTAFAGPKMAPGLDERVTKASNGTIRVAELDEVRENVDLVLEGDVTEKAFTIVRGACGTIDNAIHDLAATIDAIAPELSGLGRPIR